MKKIKKIIIEKIYKRFLKLKISKKTAGVLVVIAGLFGYTVTTETVQNMTVQDFYSFISENGGTYVEEMFRKKIDETGLEDKTETVELVGSGNSVLYSGENLQSWSDAKKKISYERKRRQIDGSCVFESFDILNILALQKQGLEVTDEPFIDIDHSYWKYSYEKGKDTGAVSASVYNQFKDKGLPVKLTSQRNADNTKYGTYYNVEKKINSRVYDYQVKTPLEKIANGQGADSFFKTLEKLEKQKGKNLMFRLSVGNLRDKKTNARCVSFYWTETPFVKSEYQNNTFAKCKYAGGHSIAGVPVGIFEFKGEPTVAIYDSTGDGNIRLIRLSVLRLINWTWEIYDVTDGVVKQEQKTEKSYLTILKNNNILKNSSKEKIKALQQYLIDKKYLNDKADGVWGPKTTKSLQNWQIVNLKKGYSGNYWGKISRAKL